MNDLSIQLIAIFQQKVHIHPSRVIGEEGRIRYAATEGDWLHLRYLLRELDGDPFPSDDPAYCFPKGLIEWGLGGRDEALTLFDNASRYYSARREYGYAALCQVESGDIYQERSEFLSALHAVGQARAYLAQMDQPHSLIFARIRLLESVLNVDTGQMQEGIEPAQEAQTIFHLHGNGNGEFLALLQLANLNVDMACFEAGRNFLEKAGHCYRSGPVLNRYEVRLRNSTAFLHWYAGDLAQGLAESIRLQHLCRRRNQLVQLVYAYVLEANLHRGMGEYEKSEQAYRVALALAAEQELPPLQRLIWVNRAWLCLLLGRVDEARHLVEEADSQADSSTRVGCQVIGAVIHLLAGHMAAAERALGTAREFYARAGDELAVCAIDFHLVHLHLRTDHRAAARQRLEDVLAWMEERRVDYFPHWWHPATVYSVLTFGEDALPQHAGLIHRMLRKHIGEELQAASREQREVIDFSNGAVEKLLQPVTSPVVCGVLRELLTSGVLRFSSFSALCQALGNGETSDARTFLLCAIFGLYLSGVPRKEIAIRIGKSEGVVRHAIRQLYERLAPELLEMTSTKARKVGLVERARAAGYVDGVG